MNGNLLSPDVVCFGEILWDILPAAALPGGAPMNVAYQLHQLGRRPALLTRIGKDARGDALLDVLNNSGIDCSQLQRDPLLPTGVVRANSNAAGEMEYEIESPSAWDNIALTPQMESLAQAAAYFVFGSLVTRGKHSQDTLLQLVEHSKCNVFDVNLRQPFYNRVLIEELLLLAQLVKLNLEELHWVTQWYPLLNTVADKINFVQDRFGIESVLVTRGAAGAIANIGGSWHEHLGYRVRVSDTIGSGDAFLAGFLHCQLAGRNAADSIAYACAMGALVASKPGGWPPLLPGELEALMGNQ